MQGTLRGFLLVPLAFAFQTAVSLGHPATASQQSPPPAQSSQDQSASQAQTLAEAARKAKEKKAASAKGKVFTEDDLSGIKKDGVSVVGTEGKKPSNSPPATGKEEED